MRDVMSQVDAVARAEGATRVTRVSLRLGALSHFTPEHFSQHFEDVARGTVAEGAVVDAVVDASIGNVRAGEIVLESVEVELPGGEGER
ncbi:MAG TPA: hydrogenase/urease maturation nickel metallochaperone HypA [Gaiella sp.]|nr:hydrogenase/urease maturation nickel metallochaperone HypA [Gaiella sp.]